MLFLIYLEILILAIFVLFTLIREKGLKLYNPAVLLSIIYFFEFGLPNLFMIFDPDQFLTYQMVNLETLAKGGIFSVLVFLLFLLGFYSPYYNRNIKEFITFLLKKIPNLSRYNIEIKNLPLVVIVLLVVGWISRIILFKSGNYYHAEVGYEAIKQLSGFQIYEQYFGIAALLPLIALSLIFIEWLKDRGNITYLLIWLVFVIIEIVYALPTGSKERVFLPLAILLFIYSLKSKLPLVPLISITLFVILFLFPFITIYRNIFLTGDAIVDLSRTYDLYRNLFKGFNKETLLGLLFSIAGERLNYALIVDVIVDNTPRIWDFKLGYSYFFFFIALIPRLIWENKPNISIFANDFGRDYGILYPTDYSTSIDVTWVGEMFLNFGWYGILVGFLYGLFYQIGYSYFLRVKKPSMLSIILYAFSLYYMVRGGMFTIQFAGLVKIFIVVLVVLYPFLRKIKQEQ